MPAILFLSVPTCQRENNQGPSGPDASSCHAPGIPICPASPFFTSANL